MSNSAGAVDISADITPEEFSWVAVINVLVQLAGGKIEIKSSDLASLESDCDLHIAIDGDTMTLSVTKND